MYYPSSENKGADQIRCYREADLRLCFRLCRLLVFPWGGSYDIFSIFAQNIEYMLDLPRRGVSNEYPQSVFWIKIKEKRYIAVYLGFTILSYIYRIRSN